MSARLQLFAVTLCVILVAPLALHADVYRWDNGQLIPGTEGITPGPGVDLSRVELEYARLGGEDLAGASFVASNLTNASLVEATLTDANFQESIVKCAWLTSTTPHGFMKEQLYSTASYQDKNLRQIRLGGNNLSGWSFVQQDLSGAQFTQILESFVSSDLRDADFSKANLTNTMFRMSDMTGANFADAIIVGGNFGAFLSHYTLTRDQLYSTASYRDKTLRGVDIDFYDLRGWDFSGQDLSNADLSGATLTGVNLIGAHLKNTYLSHSTFHSSLFDSSTIYNQWTTFPEEFDSASADLTQVLSPIGDFDADDVLGLSDISLLVWRLIHDYLMNRPLYPVYESLPLAMFDVNSDGHVDTEDHRTWIRDLKHTWYGDAALDGEFNSGDFVLAFQAGKYEQGRLDEWGNIHGNLAGWSEGDWNADGIFDSNDFIIAFQDGGYEQGPRTDVAVVPEPGGVVLLILGLVGVMRRRRTARDRV